MSQRRVNLIGADLISVFEPLFLRHLAQLIVRRPALVVQELLQRATGQLACGQGKARGGAEVEVEVEVRR